jgi:hypothetical protein
VQSHLTRLAERPIDQAADFVTEMTAELTAAFFSKKILYDAHSGYILHSAFSRILRQ